MGRNRARGLKPEPNSDCGGQLRYGAGMFEMRATDGAESAMGVPPEQFCRVLELAMGDSPLEETLSELLRVVETTSHTRVLGSVLLLDDDGKHLRHGAAPNLPKAYCQALDGAEIGPCAGSCGTAAYTAEPVFVSDIANDPLWIDFRELADAHGLRACWSIPILTAGRRVLGTFAMYHREPRQPTVRDLALVDLVTQTAALVIDRKRTQEALDRIAAIAGRAPAQSSSSS
jgi:GAF domain-containing protein